MNPTLAEWLEADETTRAVFMDWLLERIPRGYRDQRETDRSPSVFPRFVHKETGVLFHVIFGGPAVMGMTNERWERANVAARGEYTRVHGDHPELAPDAPALLRSEAAVMSPPREVEIETALVADSWLSRDQLRKIGIVESMLPRGVERGIARWHIGALIAKLPSLGWRAPSEAEWEYALRVCAGDEHGAGAAPDELLCEERVRFGRLPNELCRDDFKPTLEGYPLSGSRGDGHTVLRGGGEHELNPIVWPARRDLARARGNVSLRPWVSLLNR